MPLKLEQRSDHFEFALSTAETELAEDRFAAGFGKFREALNLSRGFPKLEEQANTFALEQAQRWIPDNWRLAKSLLVEAGQVSSRRASSCKLWEAIQQREHEENIRLAIRAADDASANGLTAVAEKRLRTLALQYPDDSRVNTRLTTLQSLLAETESAHQAATEVQAEEQRQLQVRIICAQAREFEKAGFYGDALEEWISLRRVDPTYPGLQAEVARCRALQDPAPETSSNLVDAPIIIPPALKFSASLSERTKTMISVASATLLLATAGALIWSHYDWHHVSAHDTKAVRNQITPLADAKIKLVPAADVDADDLAWASVDPKNADSVEQYLNQFPGGAHRPMAVRALIAYRQAESGRPATSPAHYR